MYGLLSKIVLMFSCLALSLKILKKKKKEVYDCSPKLQILYKKQILSLSLSINFVLNYAVFCTSNLTHQHSFITVGHYGQLQSEDSTGYWQTYTEM